MIITSTVRYIVVSPHHRLVESSSPEFVCKVLRVECDDVIWSLEELGKSIIYNTITVGK